MPKFYVTFAITNLAAGHVLPVIADDDGIVRKYVNQAFANGIYKVYTEKQWESGASRRNRWMKEAPTLDLILAQKTNAVLKALEGTVSGFR